MTVTRVTASPKAVSGFHRWVVQTLLTKSFDDRELLYQARREGYKLTAGSLAANLRWLEAQGVLWCLHRPTAEGAIKLGLRTSGVDASAKHPRGAV